MRILIIGFGSIGARHARLAEMLGMKVACVTGNQKCPYKRYSNFSEALSEFKPDRVVISNQTALHFDALSELVAAGFSGSVLVEKPLFTQPQRIAIPESLKVFVAYNLRFHPLALDLHERMGSQLLYSASFHAGQYLPQWRPSVDYRASYSASRAQGGGVLRDLSHELDLALWFCGPAVRLSAIGGHFSNLEIDSDDVFSILSVNERCPAVTTTVNYLDQFPRRLISLNTNDTSAVLDMVNGTLTINQEMKSLKIDRDVTYLAQLQAFVNEDSTTLCTLKQGMDVVDVIAAAEVSATSTTWVKP